MEICIIYKLQNTRDFVSRNTKIRLWYLGLIPNLPLVKTFKMNLPSIIALMSSKTLAPVD
jgi:hypothetical protein